MQRATTKTYQHVLYHPETDSSVQVSESHQDPTEATTTAAARIGVAVSEVVHVATVERPEYDENEVIDDTDYKVVFYDAETEQSVVVGTSSAHRGIDRLKKDAADRIGVPAERMVRVATVELPVVL
ncbi:hypothetical protein [Haloferax sulfurifontis]|uniref:Uncharacterized protein n=2 Tax=Haloferax sulfurifontis TaxID=255616 RepID=M0IMC9_9EURY|nr:hypothetical protein [Haloferax sulfurifontis]ELZ96614.1 hypothetical protein C441_04579 [Haloferax sulfurifontis ATCC BAA-897]GGC72463.1 hypothetical protein GCM10007209_37990 [Haloferax sulfurifontis]